MDTARFDHPANNNLPPSNKIIFFFEKHITQKTYN